MTARALVDRPATLLPPRQALAEHLAKIEKLKAEILFELG